MTKYLVEADIDRGVRVFILRRDAAPEGERGWFKNDDEAKAWAIRRMKAFAEQVTEEAWSLGRVKGIGD